MQKVRRHRTSRLRPLVGTRVQVLFHSPSGVLFTFPSRYWFAIGGREYLALGDGPPGFPQDSSCPAVLGCSPNETTAFRLPDFHRLWSDFPDSLAKQMVFLLVSRSADREWKDPQPHTCNACRLSRTHGLGSSEFARRYFRNHSCFLFVRLLRCFSSPAALHPSYGFRWGYCDSSPQWVTPFGYPRIKA